MRSTSYTIGTVGSPGRRKYACRLCTGRSAGTVRPAATSACAGDLAAEDPLQRPRSACRPRKMSTSMRSRSSRATSSSRGVSTGSMRIRGPVSARAPARRRPRGCGWSRTACSSRRSWVTSSSVPSYASSACSSCSIAGTSRWLVGSSSTRQLTPTACSSASAGAGALARRQRRRGPGDVVGPEPELRQQRPALRRRPAGRLLEHVDDGLRAGEPRPRLVDLAEQDAGAERRAARGRAARRPSSAPSSVVLPAPLGPTSATRSPARDLQGRPGRAGSRRAPRPRPTAWPRPRRSAAPRRWSAAAATPCAARRPASSRSIWLSIVLTRPAAWVAASMRAPFAARSLSGIRRLARTRPADRLLALALGLLHQARRACPRTPRTRRAAAAGRGRAPRGRPPSRRRTASRCAAARRCRARW